MSKSKTTCKNCEHSFKEVFEFCPHCGQKDKEKLTLGLLFNNTISNYFSVDARFFKSFIPLLFKPGYLATKFIEGKRLLYLHPAQLYLFISVVFFFLFSFQISKQEEAIKVSLKVENEIKEALNAIEDDKAKDSIGAIMMLAKLKENQKVLGIKDKDIKTIDSIFKKEGYKSDMNSISFSGFDSKKIDSLININASNTQIYKSVGLTEDSGFFQRKITEQSLKVYKDKGSLSNMLRAFYDSIPIALFILLPLFALILKLLFFKFGPYAHHLVFSFYYFSYLFTTFSILVAASLIWTAFPSWLQSLLVLSTFIYLWIAVKQFYNQTWFKGFFKSAIATFVFSILVIISVVFVGLFAFMSF